MTSSVPYSRVSSLEVSRGTIVLGSVMAGWSVGSRVGGSVAGSSVPGSSVLVGSRLAGSRFVGGRFVGGKLRLLRQPACSLIYALYSLVGSFLLRRLSTRSAEIFKPNINRTGATYSSIQLDRIILDWYNLSVFLL
jgi:hypothetical protein